MSRIDEITAMIEEEIAEDENSPYTVHYRTGKVDRNGASEVRTKKVEAMSQPIGEKERNRLPEGDRYKESRFFALAGDTVERGDKIEYKNKLFEVGFIQDWDTSMKAIAIRVD